MFVVLAVFLVAPELAAGRWGSRPVWFYWIFWSLGTGFTYFVAIVWDWTRLRSPSRTVPVLSNGLVWLVVCLVVVNGLAPYIGLKTQTSFTMYSNLRTETANNHFFMPTLRLAGFQDDIVTVHDSNLQELQSYVDSDFAMTYFEFRRLISEAADDFEVEYERANMQRFFTLHGGVASDAELREHPTWLGKLLRFRPVDIGPRSRCQH